jgi:hypothetical protein
MKITELKEKYNINAEKALGLIEYKEYLPITEKYALATAVADACLNVDRNGLYFVDSFNLNIAFVVKMITTMTNIEIEPDEIFDAYDFLVQSEYMIAILEHISSDYEATSEIMNIYINDKMSYENSTAKMLAEGLEVIYSSIYESGHNIMETLTGAISSIDIKDIPGLISKLK